MVKSIIRYLLYGKKLKFGKCGTHLIIKQNCQINNRKEISIGNDVYIGQQAHWNGLGGIEINDNVIIGPYSRILSYNHNYQSNSLLPYDQKEILKKVTIHKNVWIGLGVHINPGVTIGEGAIVAMGSVVTKNVAPLTIVGGNPAKEIGKRDENTYYKLSNENCSYAKAKRENKIQKEKVLQ